MKTVESRDVPTAFERIDPMSVDFPVPGLPFIQRSPPHLHHFLYSVCVYIQSHVPLVFSGISLVTLICEWRLCVFMSITEED